MTRGLTLSIVAALVVSSLGGFGASAAEPDSAREQLIARERAFTRALVRNDRAALNELYAPDFTCQVTGTGINLSLDSTRARFAACTALGRRAPRSRPEWLEKSQEGIPRSAELENIEVSFEGDVAIVKSSQSYRGWFPYDGLEPRLARVTDHWVKRDGRWVIQKRFSEPVKVD